MNPRKPGNKPSIDTAKNFKIALKKLFGYLSEYKKGIIVVAVFSILSTIFAIKGPEILGEAVNEIFEGIISKIGGTGGIDFKIITSTLLFLVGLYLISTIFSFVQNFVMNSIACKLAYRLRKEISEKINRMPMKYFDNITHGEVLSRITNDVDTLSQSLSQGLGQLISSAATLVGVLYMMIRISGTMTIAALLILPISLGGMALIMKKSQKYFKAQQEYIGKVNGIVEETFGGHEVIMAFGAEKKVIKNFNKANEELYTSAWKSQFYSGIIFPLMGFIGNLGYVVISILGGYLVVKGKIQIGSIVSFTQYIRNFNQTIGSVGQVAGMMQSTMAAAERIFDFLAEKEETKDIKNPVDVSNIEGNIEFKDVKFGYNEDKIVINDFDVKIKKGHKIAIVGPTGSGKTTMVKLLMRFYDINSGEILIDGKNIKDFKRGELRSLFGMVLQDAWLFNGSIADNIRYGKLDADIEEVKSACRAASVHHFIKTLPDTYDMELNEESDNISQGQKQLLTIARVILADPKILILDEATSSVDTRTEILIQRAMDKLMEGRTSFIIAHRLSTIKNADTILVMRDGDIVETGNHEELLSKDGFYKTLYNSQFEG